MENPAFKDMVKRAVKATIGGAAFFNKNLEEASRVFSRLALGGADSPALEESMAR